MSATTLNQAGQLDETFATKGLSQIVVPKYSVSEITCVLVDTNGKIYFTGVSGNDNFFILAYFLGRLNPDGTPDNSYGSNGLVIGEIAGKVFYGRPSIHLQSDGKIVWTGRSSSSVSFEALTFARYDTDGKLDSGFGTDGYSNVDIDLAPPAGHTLSPVSTTKEKKQPWSTSRAGGSASPVTMEILPDGKILACKVHDFDFKTAHSLIIRLNADGSLDLSLDQKGYIVVVHPDYPLGRTALHGILVQADGKYVCSGSVRPEYTTTFALFTRHNPDGSLDSEFGANGFVTINGRDPNIHYMVQQPNQRILGIGNMMSFPFSAVMTSIESNGTPNIQFNGGKLYYEEFVPGALNGFNSGVRQPDGKIVVVGAIGKDFDNYDITAARYIDANRDLTFNGVGWSRFHFGSGMQYATTVALQDDGKILVAGRNHDSSGFVLRLHAK
ncbi:hypothetical protein [Pseudomonas sp. PS01303]|uniref:hypothetical protein n=1 Tax=Pseudomonas sp. PS01303 TaxID=2991439 RepID=UPI00249C5CF2|nr:hypothetical protein [Pseudomonas sp. PS01303]